MKVAAAILAGGRASRMGGQAKSFLVVDGARVIDRQLAVLRTLAQEILLVANDPGPYRELGLPIVADETAGQGPLAGILAALLAARAPYVLVVACDMPFLEAAPLARLRDAPEADVAIAVGERPEPLCARYGRGCLAPIRRRLAASERRATDLLDDPEVRVARVTYTSNERRILTNVNTPEDLGRS
jgi:molybdopterin-guanine dinucleotide biosynthesis protein A